jgi:hypothetical protein
MDAAAEFDAALGRHARVALDETGLHLDRAAHRVDHAAELDDAAGAASIRSLRRPPQASQGAVLAVPASRL